MMSLIKPMILIISIGLTNGDQVIYELSDTFYSQKMKFANPENGLNEIIMFHTFHTDSILVVKVFSTGDSIKLKQTAPILWNKSNKDNFYESLLPFEVDDYNGLQLTKDIGVIRYCQLYIQVDQLSELYNVDELSHVLPIIDNWYIHVYSDAWNPRKRSMIRPQHIQVEWKDTFSNDILKRMEQLKSIGE